MAKAAWACNYRLLRGMLCYRIALFERGPSMQDPSPWFSRKFLTVLMLVLIPVIYLLHSTGPKPGDLVASGQSEQLYDLGQIQPRVETQSFGPALRLDLANPELTLIFKLSQLPAQSWPLPDWVEVQGQVRAGHYLLSLTLAADQRRYNDLLLFLVDYLPAQGVRGLAAIGPNTDASWQQLLTHVAQRSGQGQEVRPRDRRAITVLTSPATGTTEQIAFILAVQWLSSQLTAYAPSVEWDHSYSPSQVLINQSLPTSIEPMNDEQFVRLQQQLSAQAEQPRSLRQIASYSLVLLAEQLSPEFITGQPERLAKLNLEMVNDQLRALHEQ